jgi:hypothetical protein
MLNVAVSLSLLVMLLRCALADFYPCTDSLKRSMLTQTCALLLEGKDVRQLLNTAHMLI